MAPPNMAPAGEAAPFRSCRAVGRVSRTGVTRHRSPSSDYATLIRPTTTGEAAKIALTLPSPRGRGTKECAIKWRHLRAPAGAAAPQSRTLLGGEDCLSEASSAALNLSGPGQRHPKGRARAPMVLGPFAETKGPRRAGPNPRKTFTFPFGARGRNPARRAGNRGSPHVFTCPLIAVILSRDCVIETPQCPVILANEGKRKGTGSPIGVGDDRQKKEDSARRRGCGANGEN